MKNETIAKQCADLIWNKYLTKKAIADNRIAMQLTHLATEATECPHKWRVYFGIRESFEYCLLCNAKRSIES